MTGLDKGMTRQVVFISRVYQLDENNNPTDKVTTKKYMVVVHVDETDEVAPNTDLREGTLIQVRDAQGDTNYKMAPNFNTDFNYYYVQIPYSETSANIFVDAS